MVGTRDAVASRRWFHRAFSFQEKGFDATKELFGFKDGVLTNKASGREYKVGPWETPTCLELRKRLEALPKLPTPDEGLTFRNVVNGSAEVHKNPENAGGVFQVASLFNCLHAADPRHGPERGVTEYAAEAAQGPACAMACGAATVWRNYFLNGSESSCNCLADVEELLRNEKEGYFVVKNGYCLPKPPAKIGALSARLEKDKVLAYDVEEQLRVGVHWDTEVTGEGHTVCQVLCSCAPVAFTKMVKAAEWEKFACLLLDSCYESTLLVGAVLARERKERVRVFLTLIGGGAMGNRTNWIKKAIDKALTKYAEEPLEVVLVHNATTPITFLSLEESRPPPQPKAMKSITSRMKAVWKDIEEPDSDAEQVRSRNDGDSQAIAKAFEYFDRNGDGVIDKNEFTAVLQILDKDLFTDKAVDTLLSQADADGDGEVHYSEFVAWLCGDASSLVTERVLITSELLPDSP